MSDRAREAAQTALEDAAAGRILGVGVDLCDIRRIERALTRHGARFLDRIYTAAEQALCDGRGARAAGYARRWAAKEACAKALGAGLSDGSLRWRDLEVVSRDGGAPEMRLHGSAAARLAALAPPDTVPRVHVSLTDEPPYAQAFVVIDAPPRLP